MALGPGAAFGEPVQLYSDTEVAKAGYFQLRWAAESPIQLQESRSADFREARTLYSGSDNARILSGKPNGHWYYRARPETSPASWSNTVEVTVRHHSLQRALGFFTVGAIVFLATLLLIATGARRQV